MTRKGESSIAILKKPDSEVQHLIKFPNEFVVDVHFCVQNTFSLCCVMLFLWTAKAEKERRESL